MKKILAVLIIFCSFSGWSIEQNIKVKELRYICKTWGYLKYHHPKIRKGSIDWNFVLLQKLENFLEKRVSFEKTINSFFFEAGMINKKSQKKEIKKGVMLSDFSWINSEIFNTETQKKLNLILERFNGGRNHYAILGKSYIVDFKNDKVPFSLAEINNEQKKLFVLFRYWNIIEYYFPNKHLLIESWDDILDFYIADILTNNPDIELVMFGINNALNDAHGMHFSSREFYHQIIGFIRIPVHFEVKDGRVFVDQIRAKNLIGENKFQVGDEIIKCNKGSISEVYSKVQKYAPFSDKQTIDKLVARELEYYFKKEIRFEIKRKGVKKNIFFKVKPFKSLNFSTPCVTLSDDINYYNLSYFPHHPLLERTKRKVLQNLFSSDTIILDLRYTRIPFSVQITLPKYLYEKKTTFIPLIPQKNHSVPGSYTTFEYPAYGSKNKSKFKGLLVLLVNGRTGSIGEYTGLILQGYPNALTIGTRTWGSAGYASDIEIVGKEIRSKFTISAENKSDYFFSPESKVYSSETLFDNNGLKLDYEVDYTKAESLSFEKDFILQSALNYIRNNK